MGVVTGGGGSGGGNPFTGWSVDAANPANANTNGGFVRFGPGNGNGGVLLPNTGLVFTDSNLFVAADGDLDMNSQDVDSVGVLNTTATGRINVGTGGVHVGGAVVGTALQTTDGSTFLVETGGLLGVFGAAPVAQQATPVTLGDVISVLQAFGFVA